MGTIGDEQKDKARFGVKESGQRSKTIIGETSRGEGELFRNEDT